MANFWHRILVHHSSCLCINTPRPASSGALNQGIAVSPPLSLLFSCDPTSCRSTRQLLEPTHRISSHCSRNLYVSISLLSTNRLDHAKHPYQRYIFKLFGYTFDKSTLNSSTPRVLFMRTQPRTLPSYLIPYQLNSRVQVSTYTTVHTQT